MFTRVPPLVLPPACPPQDRKAKAVAEEAETRARLVAEREVGRLAAEVERIRRGAEIERLAATLGFSTSASASSREAHQAAAAAAAAPSDPTAGDATAENQGGKAVYDASVADMSQSKKEAPAAAPEGQDGGDGAAQAQAQAQAAAAAAGRIEALTKRVAELEQRRAERRTLCSSFASELFPGLPSRPVVRTLTR